MNDAISKLILVSFCSAEIENHSKLYVDKNYTINLGCCVCQGQF